jgi:hypothetical protein
MQIFLKVFLKHDTRVVFQEIPLKRTVLFPLKRDGIKRAPLLNFS